jgi:hypothetical protein
MQAAQHPEKQKPLIDEMAAKRNFYIRGLHYEGNLPKCKQAHKVLGERRRPFSTKRAGEEERYRNNATALLRQVRYMIVGINTASFWKVLARSGHWSSSKVDCIEPTVRRLVLGRSAFLKLGDPALSQSNLRAQQHADLRAEHEASITQQEREICAIIDDIIAAWSRPSASAQPTADLETIRLLDTLAKEWESQLKKDPLSLLHHDPGSSGQAGSKSLGRMPPEARDDRSSGSGSDSDESDAATTAVATKVKQHMEESEDDGEPGSEHEPGDDEEFNGDGLDLQRSPPAMSASENKPGKHGSLMPLSAIMPDG